MTRKGKVITSGNSVMHNRGLALALIMGTSIAMNPQTARGAPEDTHSFARPDQIRVTHLNLDLTVSFEDRELSGVASLKLEKAANAPVDAPLILDTRGLKILRVSKEPVGEIPFELGTEDPVKGTPLTIKLPPSATDVTISYKTTPRSSALQWLKAKGTAGGKLPFLFTQSQAIHARSWIPIQDSPASRMTYEARVHVPKGFTAAMSADRLGTILEDRGTSNVFQFSMKEPIPAYLIALAIGDLAFRPLGPRTGVYAEPSVVDAAAKEFVDTEDMVTTIERRFGSYRWGRYDLLVLPPSFPFGGMENPKLTFATPTVIAGDRSLVSLIAHELAHSWSGNLVTNATWRDFWLNEGFTTYLERRVLEDLYGKERVDMERILGRRELTDEIKEFAPRDQILHVDLTGRDPDEGMTRIPYEKGSLFLETLESTYGRERFDAFLKGYFDHFAFKSITTADFLAYLRANLIDVEPKAAESVDLESWIDKPGLPSKYPPVSSNRFVKVEEMAKAWSIPETKIDSEATRAWTTHEWVHFLQSLPNRISLERMAALDTALGLTNRGNAEVAEQWLVIAIRNGYAPADARLEKFLTTIGRRKFLMPLYGELNKTPEGAKKARQIFASARPFCHPISAESVARLLGVEKNR